MLQRTRFSPQYKPVPIKEEQRPLPNVNQLELLDSLSFVGNHGLPYIQRTACQENFVPMGQGQYLSSSGNQFGFKSQHQPSSEEYQDFLPVDKPAHHRMNLSNPPSSIFRQAQSILPTGTTPETHDIAPAPYGQQPFHCLPNVDTTASSLFPAFVHQKHQHQALDSMGWDLAPRNNIYPAQDYMDLHQDKVNLPRNEIIPGLFADQEMGMFNIDPAIFEAVEKALGWKAIDTARDQQCLGCK